MNLRIDELGKLLDPQIAKARKPKSGIAQKEEQIRKGLSFDPFNPIEMNDQSPYYNPYAVAPEGGFFPHSVDHWKTQGKALEGYRTVHSFYEDVGVEQPNFDTMVAVQNQEAITEGQFSFVKKAEPMKNSNPMGGHGLPVGTIHPYKNGMSYQKISLSPPQWRLVKRAGGKQGFDHEAEHVGHANIDNHAETTALKAAISKKKQGTKDTVKTIKDTIKQHLEQKGSVRAVQKQIKDTVQEHYIMQKKPKKPSVEVGAEEKPIEKKVQSDKPEQGKKTQTLFDVGPHEFGGHDDVKAKKEEGKEKQKNYGTKDDEGRVHNEMGVPPPENESFLKEGKTVTFADAEKFVDQFAPIFEKSSQAIEKSVRDLGAVNYSSRLKEVKSLHEKMNDRLSSRSLNTVTDAMGMRALTDSLENQQKIAKEFAAKHNVVEYDDSVDKKRPGGYRAIHILFKAEDGKIGEFQIKTNHQQIFAGYAHDSVYKGKDEVKNSPLVKQWLEDMSDYLYSRDKGEKGLKRPKVPAILEAEAGVFPWHLVGQSDIGKKKWIMKGEKMSKFLANARNKKTGKMETTEHGNMAEARQANKDREATHDPESIGMASSMDEYYTVMHEDDPDTHFSGKSIEGKPGARVKSPIGNESERT